MGMREITQKICATFKLFKPIQGFASFNININTLKSPFLKRKLKIKILEKDISFIEVENGKIGFDYLALIRIYKKTN